MILGADRCPTFGRTMSSVTPSGPLRAALLALAFWSGDLLAGEGLPPVPVPAENPITEPKRVLGKILFWEEQLSSDNTMACGTCHRQENGSADPRTGIHPGADGIFGNADDVFGSPGVRRQDASGELVFDDLFGFDVQITRRAAAAFVGNQWSPLLFWDGRASSEFRDPQTGEVVIESGGALENQAVHPLLDDVEMAHENRTWAAVIDKLESATPMALATELPPDMAAALSDAATYGDLFDDAFGTPDINAARIAMAIATYERTVVPDQTPWDLHTLTSRQSAGLLTFLGTSCTTCHSPPQFTSNTFRNIGLRDPDDDPGRFEVTHNADDRGRFKVPSLRNVGLRDRLMHTGHITGVADAIQFYRGIGHTHFPDNQDPLVQGGIVISESAVADMIDFLENGLTDPRAAAGEFPFDRPKLFSEVTASVAAVPPALLGLASAPNPFRSHTVIRYTTTPGPVELAVYDAAGRLVRRIVAVGAIDADGVDAEGVGATGVGGDVDGVDGAIAWDGKTRAGLAVPAGVYFVRLTTPNGAASIPIVRME
jgi:cytochrome c peroxidase